MKPFTACLNHHRVARREQPLRQWINFFLQQRLASGQLNQGNSPGTAVPGAG